MLIPWRIFVVFWHPPLSLHFLASFFFQGQFPDLTAELGEADKLKEGVSSDVGKIPDV